MADGNASRQLRSRLPCKKRAEPCSTSKLRQSSVIIHEECLFANLKKYFVFHALTRLMHLLKLGSIVI